MKITPANLTDQTRGNACALLAGYVIDSKVDPDNSHLAAYYLACSDNPEKFQCKATVMEFNYKHIPIPKGLDCGD